MASEWRRGRLPIGERAAAIVGFAVWIASAAAVASPGALTSAAELAEFRELADAGSLPQAADRTDLLSDARTTWAWGTVSGEYGTTQTTTSKSCHPVSPSTGTNYLVRGASDAYAQVLGAYLAGDDSLAREARDHVLDLTDTYGFHGLSGDYNGNNQCVLDLAISIPIWIETARLLEDTSVWSAADSALFRSWLASQVYPKVAWASRVRRNNWGAAGSLASYTIATYLEGAVASLQELSPVSLTLSPAQAITQHRDMQLSRIGTTWVGDAQCAKRGIQWHGGIPEELRRGTTGCDGTYLLQTNGDYTYQIMHTELLVFHAQAARRRGDLSLYQATTSGGTAAILQTILFVIANPSASGLSWPWDPNHWGALITASMFYDDATLKTAAEGDATFRGGRTLPYARITSIAQSFSVLGPLPKR